MNSLKNDFQCLIPVFTSPNKINMASLCTTSNAFTYHLRLPGHFFKIRAVNSLPSIRLTG